MKELTAKQLAFVDAYISNGGNGTKAYEKAYGQKESARISASRLLSKDNISAEIQKRLEEVKSTRTAKVEDALAYISAVLKGEAVEVNVLVVGNGRAARVEQIETPPKIKDRLKAAEMILKFNLKGESEPVTAIKIIRAGVEK